MTVLETIRHDDIHELHLARPPVNAFNPELVNALRGAVLSAPAHGARGIVVSGHPGMFSAGLDVPSLLQLDRAAMGVFWSEFVGLCEALARSPIPVVAAITGHSPAGGAVLTLYCDYRVMARGAFRIGLNEVQVGLVVPEIIQAAMRRLLGAHRAERLMVAGSMIEAEEALRVGLVDELVDTELVVGRALGWLQDLLKLPPQAMSETRRIARADLHAQFDAVATIGNEVFAERWFCAEAQGVLHAMVARLKARRA
ncbi:MAG TPA: enoyl-CoA hydratase/isomerase family protein [Dokdonella sp.]|uniref:enoyl-CoA hydratase/isomerase family protein n=1 Tax=Dokdonella sp. TaxID=2291710 RepID=UPI002CF75D88|nr:enoyl-CoA hydratase/isomerase family protein [Dokdonella sp.]HOX72430.1 enoyl-CoA hydratase/isomerase family protein [Dokdonella sp.]HPG93059.1 enoyl-CoA hydratase/isomerase family protein [Dokdonella sp.]HPN80466.1 enoyl-CoA hydratase/isomerase family protein [Dokdonella sp.]